MPASHPNQKKRRVSARLSPEASAALDKIMRVIPGLKETGAIEYALINTAKGVRA